MITTVSSIAALTATLQTAQSGDTILLAAGQYGRLSIADVHFSSDVIIGAANPAAATEITGLSISNSNGLTFRNLDFVADPTAGPTPLSIVGSQDVHFDQVHVHGALDGSPATDTGGLFFRGSSNVSVTNSEFYELYWGINHLDSSRLTFSNNTFHDLRLDGIRGGGSSDITISSNTFRDFYPISGDHPDAIQFWTTGTTASASNITISDNVILRGSGAPPQGVFLRDELGGLPFTHVLITGNFISGALYNGLHINGGSDVTVSNNVVQGYVDQKSWISLAYVTGGQLTNNATTLFNHGSGLTNVLDSGNALLTPAVDYGAALLTQWLSTRGSSASAAMYANVPSGPPPVGQAIQGDTSANTLKGAFGDDTISGQTGNDTIADTGGSNYLRGDDGNDQITGGTGFDDINGNAGDDTLRGGGGGDWVVGGKDNDIVAGEDGDDIVYGNLGNDTCDGGDGNDIVRGGQGDDQVKGNAGDDYVSGDKGNDTLIGGAGADTFHSFGNAGLDRVTDFNRSQGDRVLLDLGTTYSVSQVGADTVIDMTGGGQMILVGVSMASLTGAWLVLG